MIVVGIPVWYISPRLFIEVNFSDNSVEETVSTIRPSLSSLHPLLLHYPWLILFLSLIFERSQLNFQHEIAPNSNIQIMW